MIHTVLTKASQQLSYTIWHKNKRNIETYNVCMTFAYYKTNVMISSLVGTKL